MTQNPRMIERRIVFGVCEDVKDGIHYFDENYIVWVAGKSLILHDTQLGTQEIVLCTQTCEGVTAMTLSSSHRLLAVAEAGRNPSIVIYLFDPTSSPRLRRRSVLHIPDVGSSEYVSLSFSRDGCHLVALGGFPEWKLVYWDVEKHKMLAHCSALGNAFAAKDPRHLSQCSIAPHSNSLICVTGRERVRFFTFIDGHLSASSDPTWGIEDKDTHYLSHSWMIGEDGRLIVSTDNGDLLLFENQIYRYPLPLSPSDGIAITALISYSKGFACGGDMGLITIFERTRSKEMYRKVRSFRFAADGSSGATADLTTSSKVGGDVPIIRAFSLTPPPAEEFLAFLTSTKQIYHLNLPNADFTKAEDMIFQPVGQPFHSGSVVGVDTCIQRPLVVTAGRDGDIFLWNTITNVVEMRKHFHEEIFSVALHPSGLHMMIGFGNSLRIFNVYEKDLCEYKRLSIRASISCCFSHGGQYFAVANSTIIHVYYSYTCELLGHLRGHNSKVRSLYFVPPDDTRVISSGADGAVFEFSLCDFHKVHDNAMKAVTYHAAVADANTIWAAGNDRKLRQIDRATMQHIVEYELSGAPMCCLVVSQALRLLFGGCEDGTVRVYNTYLGEKLNFASDRTDSTGPQISAARRDITIETHMTHTGTVVALQLTYDESMLITVGDDGVVAFWNIVAPHRGMVKELEYTTELLMDRRDLDVMSKRLRTLTTQVADLKERMMQQQVKRERQHEEQIAHLDREYGEEMRKQKNEIAELEAAKGEQAIRFTEYMAEVGRKTTSNLHQTEEDYTSKIESLSSRAEQLRHLLQEGRDDFTAKSEGLRATAMGRRREEKLRQQKELTLLDDEQHHIALEKDRNQADVKAMCMLIEGDNDSEIVKAKEQYEKRHREQDEELVALQATNHALLSKENLTRAELETKLADVTEKLRQQTVLESQIDSAKRDIEALTNELRERGETIADKDRRIQDLKTKNQELEKFKFVLEYKIKELKTQIDPKDNEIRASKEKLTHMETETAQYTKSNEHLVLQIKSLRQKRAAQQKELDGLVVRRQDADEFQARMWAEISDIYQEMKTSKDKKKLKNMAKLLHDTYTSGRKPATHKVFTSARTAADELKDYNRERDHLERNLASLKRKITKDEENNRVEKQRITSENVILVREINDLRKEARSLATKAGVVRPTDPHGISAYDEEFARETAIQRSEMDRLRRLAGEFELKLKAKGIPLPSSSS